MSLRQSRLLAAVPLVAAGLVLLWLSSISCWSAEHLLERGQDTRGRLHDDVPATLDFSHHNGQQEVTYSTQDMTAVSAEAIVVAESLSESLKQHFSPFRANVSKMTAHEHALGQPATDYDWVFMPEVCSGQANRNHAPPASV